MPAARSERPALVPVDVPWQIGRSAAHFRCRMLEGFIGFPVLAEFVALFSADGEHEPPRGIPSAFEDGPSRPTAPYHLVRVLAAKAYWARYSPAVSESQVIREEDYDWSAVPGGPRGRQPKREQWTTAGRCPDPGMYEVRSSPWLAEIGSSPRVERKHYLLVGSDSSLEVVAQGWEWKLGQAVAVRNLLA